MQKCIKMFPAALFVIMKNWKQSKCLSIKNELWFIHTVRKPISHQKNEDLQILTRERVYDMLLNVKHK